MSLQPTAIVFPDVELVLTTYLRTVLADPTIYVSNAVPSPRRDRMVTVRRDGGAPDGVRDRARVSVGVWAMSEKAANDLARIVQARLSAAPNGDPILSVRHQSGPTPVADESKQSRRFLVVEVSTRGQLLGA